MRGNYSFRNAARNPYTRGRMTDEMLRAFVIESNKIEGILRPPTDREIAVHEDFLALCEVTVANLEHLVMAVAQAKLRDQVGMDVRVGDHVAPRGGPHIAVCLQNLLNDAQDGDDFFTPHYIHVQYEHLHPFMDGNGRSGRALWLWMMKRNKDRMLEFGFLHAFYYQALSASRR